MSNFFPEFTETEALLFARILSRLDAAANRHPGQVRYSHTPRQEVRESESQAAHAAALS